MTDTAIKEATATVELTRDEIHELIDILIWASQQSHGRRTQGAVDSAWSKLARAAEAGPGTDEPPLIVRAVSEYLASIGNVVAVDRFNDVIPAGMSEHDCVHDVDGQRYVVLRNVAGTILAVYIVDGDVTRLEEWPEALNG